MKIQIVKIGKPASSHYTALVDEFRKRLTPFAKIEAIEIKAREGQEASPQQVLSLIDESSLTVCLDERGKMLSSPELARTVSVWQENPAVKTVTIIIGGPYGLDEKVREKADLLWSLSPAVFPSDLAWLMVWEQIYRAFTILKGIKYHHA